jgi:hypothetical protein
MTPCSSLKVSRSFGGTNRLHLQDRRIYRARNQHKVGSKRNFKGLLGVVFQNTGILHNHRCENTIPCRQIEYFRYHNTFSYTLRVRESKKSISYTCSIGCKNFRWKYPIKINPLLYYIASIQYNSSPFIKFK